MAREEFTDQWAAMGQYTLEPMLRFNTVAAEAYERFMNEQLAFGRNCVDITNRSLRMFSHSRNPQEFVAEQQEILGDFGKCVSEYAGELGEIARETQQHLASWSEDAYRSGAEQAERGMHQAANAAGEAARESGAEAGEGAKHSSAKAERGSRSKSEKSGR